MGVLQRRFARVAARSVTAAAVSLAVLGSVASAQASVVFDFVAIAGGLGGGQEGQFDNTASYATVGGITVQASASNTFGATSVAYLDDVAFTPPLDAGLGVCSDGLNASGSKMGQCITPSDDNVTDGETLTLSFFSDTAATNPITVTLDPVFLRDADHLINFGGSDLIDITDGGGLMTLTLAAQLGTPLTGSTFDFTYNNQQFYIQSITVTPVPLPAALPLFLSALAGLAFIGRRRRRQAAA